MAQKHMAIPQKWQPWLTARTRYRLSHAQIQMARELGMNPKKLGGLANHRQEPWKVPLPQFIEECYRKRFGRSQPLDTRSIEERVAAQAAKKTAMHGQAIQEYATETLPADEEIP